MGARAGQRRQHRVWYRRRVNNLRQAIPRQHRDPRKAQRPAGKRKGARAFDQRPIVGDYQTFNRSAGAKYSFSPGFDPNAA